MATHLDDKRVRLAAFRWLDEQVARHGEVLPRGLLLDGFMLDGQRIPLMSQQGIFKPKVLERIPLSITTTPHGPYGDQLSPDGLLLYSYRGTDPAHHENAGLREAMLKGTPLIYLYGILRSRYVPRCLGLPTRRRIKRSDDVDVCSSRPRLVSEMLDGARTATSIEECG